MSKIIHITTVGKSQVALYRSGDKTEVSLNLPTTAIFGDLKFIEVQDDQVALQWALLKLKHKEKDARELFQAAFPNSAHFAEAKALAECEMAHFKAVEAESKAASEAFQRTMHVLGHETNVSVAEAA